MVKPSGTNQTFSLRSERPKSVRINKVLVILLSAFCLFIFIFAIVESFSTASRTQPKQATVEDVPHSMTTEVSPALDNLPQGYDDVDAIQQYVPKPPPSTPAQQSISPEIQQMLDTLKQKESQLEQQLSDVSRAREAQQSTNDMRMRQAQDSGLFFAGAAPEPPRSQPSDHATTSTESGKSADDKAGGASDKETPYDSQNMQQEKLDFLKSSASDKENIYDMHPMTHPFSQYEVQAGTILAATLITAIDTSLPGEVVAQVRQNVYDTISGQFLLIPQGSKLIGKYQSQVSYGQTRVLIAFTRVIRPDGTSMLLDKSGGSDLFGQAGMSGNVDNHWGKILGASVISTLLSVGAGQAAGYSNNNNYPSPGENAMYSAAGNIAQTGQQLTSRAMDIQPTLTIPAGYEFNVIVNKDMVLMPYG